jgi:hypothetical protein
MTSQNNHFATRDRLIIDRLWQMKKAATEILNLTNIEMPDGTHDCDGTCPSCVLGDLEGAHCSDIVEIAYMDIPDCCQDQKVPK